MGKDGVLGGFESRLRAGDQPAAQAQRGTCCDSSQAKEFGLEPAVSPIRVESLWKFLILCDGPPRVALAKAWPIL